MPELNLNVSDLEIESLVISTEDETHLLNLTFNAVGHGLIDIGASCCSILPPHGLGSCAATDELAFE